MTQRTVTEKFAAASRRPDFWLLALLVWISISSTRSLGTPWAAAAGTEALRWGAGIGLALTLGWFWRHTELAGQFLVTLTGVMALFGILGGETAAHSGLAGPYHDHQLYGSVLVLLLPFCCRVCAFGLVCASGAGAAWRQVLPGLCACFSARPAAPGQVLRRRCLFWAGFG